MNTSSRVALGKTVNICYINYANLKGHCQSDCFKNRATLKIPIYFRKQFD